MKRLDFNKETLLIPIKYHECRYQVGSTGLELVPCILHFQASHECNVSHLVE
jgi:hypothetical protein